MLCRHQINPPLIVNCKCGALFRLGLDQKCTLQYFIWHGILSACSRGETKWDYRQDCRSNSEAKISMVHLRPFAADSNIMLSALQIGAVYEYMPKCWKFLMPVKTMAGGSGL